LGTVGWLAVAYLALGSSILGYITWYWALARGGIARIAVLQFAQPVATLVLAALILDEPLRLPLALAGAGIILGIAIAQRGGATVVGARRG
jgi:drug/metabolite transporter (DMT)-like permease